jgi:hypothetical protein
VVVADPVFVTSTIGVTPLRPLIHAVLYSRQLRPILVRGDGPVCRFDEIETLYAIRAL